MPLSHAASAGPIDKLAFPLRLHCRQPCKATIAHQLGPAMLTIHPSIRSSSCNMLIASFYRIAGGPCTPPALPHDPMIPAPQATQPRPLVRTYHTAVCCSCQPIRGGTAPPGMPGRGGPPGNPWGGPPGLTPGCPGGWNCGCPAGGGPPACGGRITGAPCTCTQSQGVGMMSDFSFIGFSQPSEL